MFELNEITLEQMPTLKKLLIEYCFSYYEEAADIRTEYLIAEYHILERENRLNDLFVPELLASPLPPS